MSSVSRKTKADDNSDSKRKRSETSSTSEADTSINSEAAESSKVKKKKAKKMASIKEKSDKDSKTENITDNSIAAQLKALNSKMANVMTKDDKSLKIMMKIVFQDMKEDFLKSVFHRIELLEGKIYEKDKENDKLKDHIKDLNSKIETQDEEISTLRSETDQAEVTLKGKINALEQYGRRNNVRIEGLINDKDETAMMTSHLIIKKLNENIEGLNLKFSDIDTAHRIGKVKNGNKRQVIVKFVSRLTKDNLMYKKNQLKNTGLYVNEDLTSINAYVMACIRKKLPDEVDRVWSNNGLLSYTNKMGHIHKVPYKDFQHRMDLDWPKDTTSVKSNGLSNMETLPDESTSVLDS